VTDPNVSILTLIVPKMSQAKASTMINVSGLKAEVKKVTLHKMFRPFGKIESVSLVTDLVSRTEKRIPIKRAVKRFSQVGPSALKLNNLQSI